MKSITIRFEDDVYAELLELRKIMPEMSLNLLVNNCVRDEYSKFGEDPKIKQALSVLDTFKKSLEEMQAQLK